MNTDSNTNSGASIRIRSATFDSTLLVLLITAFAYAVGFAYEYGYLSYFRVPVELVEVGLQETLVVGALTFGVITSLYVLADFFTGKIPHYVSSRTRNLVMLLGSSYLVILTMLWLMHANWAGWVWGIVVLVFLGYNYFIEPIWRKENQMTYWQRVDAAVNRGTTGRSERPLSTAIANAIGLSGYMVLLAAGAILFLANKFGSYRAGKDGVFLMPRNGPSCVVLREDAAGLLCVAVDAKSRSALPDYQFLDPRMTELVVRKVGPFSRAKLSRKSAVSK